MTNSRTGAHTVNSGCSISTFVRLLHEKLSLCSKTCNFKTYLKLCNHISVFPLLCVEWCGTVSVQCFFSSVVGVTGSTRLLRWPGTDRNWQWKAPRLQVRRPPTASPPQAEQQRSLNITCRWYQRHVWTAWAVQRI